MSHDITALANLSCTQDQGTSPIAFDLSPGTGIATSPRPVPRDPLNFDEFADHLMKEDPIGKGCAALLRSLIWDKKLHEKDVHFLWDSFCEASFRERNLVSAYHGIVFITN